jgi:hypothetical protein
VSVFRKVEQRQNANYHRGRPIEPPFGPTAIHTGLAVILKHAAGQVPAIVLICMFHLMTAIPLVFPTFPSVGTADNMVSQPMAVMKHDSKLMVVMVTAECQRRVSVKPRKPLAFACFFILDGGTSHFTFFSRFQSHWFCNGRKRASSVTNSRSFAFSTGYGMAIVHTLFMFDWRRSLWAWCFICWANSKWAASCITYPVTC